MVLRTTKQLSKIEHSEAVKRFAVEKSFTNVFQQSFLPRRLVFFGNPEMSSDLEINRNSHDDLEGSSEDMISLAEIEEVEKAVFENGETFKNSDILDAIYEELKNLKFSGEHLEKSLHQIQLETLNHILDPLHDRSEVPKSLIQEQAHSLLQAELQSLRERNALLRQIKEQNPRSNELLSQQVLSRLSPFETSLNIQEKFLDKFMSELSKRPDLRDFFKSGRVLSAEDKKILRGLAKLDIRNHEQAILESLQNGSTFTYDQINFSWANDHIKKIQEKIAKQPVITPAYSLLEEKPKETVLPEVVISNVEPEIEETESSHETKEEAPSIPKDVIGEAKKRYLANQTEGDIPYQGMVYHFRFKNEGNRLAQLTFDIPGDGSKVLTLKLPKKRRNEDIYDVV